MSLPLNLDQIMRLAMYQAGQVKQSGTAGSIVSTYELQTWANQGNLILENALRRVSDDYFVKKMDSSLETTAQTLQGIAYTPSTSLALAASTREYTLPPDFLSLRSIRCVTSSYEYLKFYQKDIASKEFQDWLKDPDTHSPGTDLFYDIVGERTLVIVPMLNAAVDIEIRYVAKTKQLVTYSTGTLTVTDAETTVTGSSTFWLARFDASYLDILFGTSGSATLPVAYPSLAYDSVSRSKVSAIATNTSLTLGAAKNGTLAAGTGYILSSLPVIPDEYHSAIADYITYHILLKANSTLAKSFRDEFEKTLARINSIASRRPMADVETVEDVEFL